MKVIIILHLHKLDTVKEDIHHLNNNNHNSHNNKEEVGIPSHHINPILHSVEDNPNNPNIHNIHHQEVT